MKEMKSELYITLSVMVMGFALVLLGKLPAETFFQWALGGGSVYGGFRTLLKLKNGTNGQSKEEKDSGVI